MTHPSHDPFRTDRGETPPPVAPDLVGRTALVTGASRGIGAAVARRLDAAGARVALSARSAGDLRAVADGLAHDPVVLPADLLDPAAATGLADRAVEELGGVDVLVNVAGVVRLVPSDRLTPEAVDEAFALDVRAVLLLAGRLAVHMAGRGGGAIVTVSSVVTGVGTPLGSLYAATKAALDGMTRALAAEWGPGGVRVNSVRPGVVGTDRTLEFVPDEVLGSYAAQVPLRRIGRARDVADVVGFLVGPGAAYLSAEDVVLDGGWSATRTIVRAQPA